MPLTLLSLSSLWLCGGCLFASLLVCVGMCLMLLLLLLSLSFHCGLIMNTSHPLINVYTFTHKCPIQLFRKFSKIIWHFSFSIFIFFLIYLYFCIKNLFQSNVNKSKIKLKNKRKTPVEGVEIISVPCKLFYKVLT